MPKLLVTGANGFIGESVLRKACDFEDEVYALQRNASANVSTAYQFKVQPHIIAADLNKYDSIAEIVKSLSPEMAILTAWEALPNYDLNTCLKNLYAQTKLIESLIQASCKKIILAGSCWQYGNIHDLVSETTQSENVGLFGTIKNSIYSTAVSMAQGTDTDICEGRIFFSYGPRQRSSSLIPYVLQKIGSNLIPEIRNPDQANDFIFIDDVASALVTIARDSNSNGIYNISSGKTMAVRDVVNLICDLLGKSRLYESTGPSKGLCGANDKLKSLGWKPVVDLKSGIQEMLMSLNITVPARSDFMIQQHALNNSI